MDWPDALSGRPDYARGRASIVRTRLVGNSRRRFFFQRASRRESLEANLGAGPAALVQIVLNLLYWGYPCRRDVLFAFRLITRNLTTLCLQGSSSSSNGRLSPS